MRRVIRWSVLIVAAFLINAGVVVACALWIDGMPLTLHGGPTYEGASHLEQLRWDVEIWETWGSTAVFFNHTRKARHPRPLFTSTTSQERKQYQRALRAALAGELPLGYHEPAKNVCDVPWWSGANERPPSAHLNCGWIEDARGWPFRSFLAVHRRCRNSADWRQAWQIDLGSDQGPLGLPKAIPLRPLWRGLLANTGLFAVLLGLPFWVSSVAARGWRRRRMRCPACGYPTGAATRCSECGGMLSGRAGES